MPVKTITQPKTSYRVSLFGEHRASMNEAMALAGLIN
jgi:hypothetical protein